MDNQDSAQLEVIQELREIRVLVNNLKDDVEKLVKRTSLDGEFGRQLADMKKTARTWEKILARFGCDAKFRVCNKQNYSRFSWKLSISI